MEFGFINLFAGIVIVVMLIPNIIYAVTHRDAQNVCENKVMNLLEQIGRYASMALMVLPLGVWEFGFASVAECLIYFFGNCALLLSYLVIWCLYFAAPTRTKAMALAIIPACIFLLSALMLRHWLLLAAAAVFAVGHVYITSQNADR